MNPFAYHRLRKTLSAYGITLSEAAFKQLLPALRSEQQRPLRNMLKASVRATQYKTQPIPLDTLLARLRSNGIAVDPATMLDIQRIVATPSLMPARVADLDVVLRPLVCKHESRIPVFNKAFAEFLAEVRGMAGEEEVSIEALESDVRKAFTFDTRMRKAVGCVLFVIACVILLSICRHILTNRERPAAAVTVKIEATLINAAPDSFGQRQTYFVQGDSVMLVPQVRSIDGRLVYHTRAVWILHDTVQVQTPKLSIKLDSTSLKVEVLIYNGKHLIARGYQVISAECEKIPAAAIERLTDARLGKRIRYKAVVSNPSPDSLKYKFSWKINGRAITANTAVLDTILFQPSGLSIRVDITYPGNVHCSKDSLTAIREDDIGEIPVSTSGEGGIALKLAVKWWYLVLYAVVVILLSYAVNYLWVRYSRRKTKTIPQEISAQGKDEPYVLKFGKQITTIRVDKAITEQTINFNKRQTSEVMVLDIHKTIQVTARAGGFPVMAYRAIAKKQSFVFLVDTSIVTGHRLRLVEFLLDFLTRNQIEIFPFRYYRTPQQLTALASGNGVMSLKDVSRSYTGSNLVIFSTADHFFPSDSDTPYAWASGLKESWNNKTLVTFTYETDLFKAKTLNEWRIHVIPFDISIITNTLFQGFNETLASGFGYALTSDWQDIDRLECYLADDRLKQWVFAMAVYPRPDWELTLALGNALDAYHANNTPLVNYLNLEILSWIEWLNDGILSDELRGAMLNKLHPEVHKLARQTLHQLLQQIKPSIRPNSAVWNEYQILEAVNEITLKGIENDRAYLKNNFGKIEVLQQTGNLDAAIEKDLLDDSSMYGKAAKDFRRQSRVWDYILRGSIPVLIFALSFLIIMNTTGLKLFFDTQASDTIRFIVHNHRPNDSTMVDPAMSVRIGSEVFTPSRLNDSAFFIKALPASATNIAANVRIDWRSGDSLIFTFDSLRRVNYLNIEGTDSRLPVVVYINNAEFVNNARQIINALTLSDKFRLRMEPQVNDTITHTGIYAPEHIFSELYGIVKANNGLDTLSRIERLRMADRYTKNDSQAKVYLYYRKQSQPIVGEVLVDAVDGLQLKEFSISGPVIKTTMAVAFIDPALYRPRVVGMSKNNLQGVIPAREMEINYSAVAIVGSGFVESDSPLKPNGFLKVDGQVINDVKTQGYNGIVGVKNDELSFLSSSSSVRDLVGGFQTGPFFVKNGNMVYNTRLKTASQRFNRAFVGMNNAGKIIVGVTQEPVALTDLANYLSSSDAPPELRCRYALNLAGAGSEVLLVRGYKSIEQYGRTDDSQAALIEFMPRSSSDNAAAAQGPTRVQQSNQTPAITENEEKLNNAGEIRPEDNYDIIYNESSSADSGDQTEIADGIVVYVDSYSTKDRRAAFRVVWRDGNITPVTLRVNESRRVALGDKAVYTVTMKLLAIGAGGKNPQEKTVRYTVQVARASGRYPLSPGLEIAGGTMKNSTSTVGIITCFVRDAAANHYLITADNLFKIGETVFSNDSKGASQPIGTVQSSGAHAALIKLSSSVVMYSNLPFERSKIITGVASDIKPGQEVTFYSNRHQPVKIQTSEVNASALITSSKNRVKMDGLIRAVGANIVPGDVGAPVLSEEGKLVGFIYASDNTNTYIVPIQPVLDNLKLQLVTY